MTEYQFEETLNVKDRVDMCPFCGGEAEVKKYRYAPRGDIVSVQCKSCGATSRTFAAEVEYCAVDEAVKAWNRRTY